MSRPTWLCKFIITSSLCLTASAASAATLWNQPRYEPDSGDHGAYSVQDQNIGSTDPDLAKAYDNFSLTNLVELTGVDWDGIWAEPLPGALSDVDFIVEIWNDDAGKPDLSAPIMTKIFEGGATIGLSGPDLTVVGVADISPSTPTTPGGGPGATYSGTIPGGVGFSGTNILGPGDYWISILADQTFDNPAPVVDPEWQWHISNPGDGFYQRDRTLDPVDTPEYGLLVGEKDLAFRLRGEIVPEPNTIVLSMFGVAALGLFRRRRSS